jgi:predicted NBD/HSP70 family sugar kinase
LSQYCNANLITDSYCQRQYVLGNRNVETYPDIIGISQLVNEGDEVAQAIVREKMAMLCVGIVNAIHMFDPEAIVFESELSPCIDYIYSIFREEFSRYLPKDVFNSLQLIPPSFEHGGSIVYGAGALVFSKMTEALI